MNIRALILVFLFFLTFTTVAYFLFPVQTWLQTKWDKAQKQLKKKLRV